MKKKNVDEFNVQINKVRFDKKAKSVIIEYDQLMNDKDDIKIVLKSSDEPLDEFQEALKSLSPFVEQICMLEKGYCDQAEIRSVSFSWSHDIMGAVITSLIPIETALSPIIINTPHLPSDQYNDNGEAPLLPPECVEILNTLIKEGIRYIDGERKPPEQTELEFSTN